jgi:hypothetical protein
VPPGRRLSLIRQASASRPSLARASRSVGRRESLLEAIASIQVRARVDRQGVRPDHSAQFNALRVPVISLPASVRAARPSLQTSWTMVPNAARAAARPARAVRPPTLCMIQSEASYEVSASRPPSARAIRPAVLAVSPVVGTVSGMSAEP